MKNLFGEEQTETHIFKDGRHGVRGPNGGKHYVQPRGYAFKPGTGPEGKKCGDCANASRQRRWAKCVLCRSMWTGGRATDILLGAPACKFFKEAVADKGPDEK